MTAYDSNPNPQTKTRRLASSGRRAVLALVALSALTFSWLAVAGESPSSQANAGVSERSTVLAAPAPTSATRVWHRSITIEGLEIFYREAGSRDNPTLLLLHGFPTSSHMFRDLIPVLADRYHLVAPDYPGYGNSSMPRVDEFDYTFDALARIVDKLTIELELDRYSLYLMDYGAPVGFRLATAHPERVEALIVQNGNAYVEGIDNDFWEPIRAYWKDRGAVDQGFDNPFWSTIRGTFEQPELANVDALRFLVTFGATKWQYLTGVRDAAAISPDNWHVTQRLLDRPGNEAIQLQLFYDYGSNPPLYPAWQAYLRQHQPPTLIVWGTGDQIFPTAGAHPYLRDLPDAELHLLDTGHFALEEDLEVIATLMREFLARKVGSAG